MNLTVMMIFCLTNLKSMLYFDILLRSFCFQVYHTNYNECLFYIFYSIKFWFHFLCYFFLYSDLILIFFFFFLFFNFFYLRLFLFCLLFHSFICLPVGVRFSGLAVLDLFLFFFSIMFSTSWLFILYTLFVYIHYFAFFLLFPNYLL